MTRHKRLEALERAAEQERAARIRQNRAIAERAFGRLSAADIDLLREIQDAPDELLSAVTAAGAPYEINRDTHAELIAWLEREEVDESAPLEPAPAGAVQTMEEFAARCSESLESLEDDSDQTLTKALLWGRTLWRWHIALALEIDRG